MQTKTLVHKVTEQNSHKQQIVCHRCGGTHLANTSQFQSYDCHKCGKKGHLGKVCKSNSQQKSKQATNQISLDTESSQDSDIIPPSNDEAYTLFSLGGKTSPIVVTVHVNSHPLLLEVDTGAALSIINKTTFERNFPDLSLKPSNISLKTYTGEQLQVLGTIDVTAKYKDRIETLPLVVVEGKGPNLLGRNWLEKIRLDWHNVYHTSGETRLALRTILQNYSAVFREELGCMNIATAKIHVSNAKPKFFKARPSSERQN